MQTVSDIIEEFGLSFCPLLDDGHYLLSDAVEKSQVEMVEYLLRKNAKVNSNRDVLSPLQIAAMNDNTIIFELLLEHGATISYNNIYKNKSPIKLAVEHSNVDIARLIVEHKNFGKKYDQFLLHTAVKNDSFPMVTFLLEIGMDVNEYDDDRSAPIHHALMARNNDILQLLLNYGADVDAKNKYGDTPVCLVLMQPDSRYFASSDFFELSILGNTQNKSKLDILLDNDADINAQDISKYFPPIPRHLRMHFPAHGRVEYSTSTNKKRIIKHIVKLRSRNVPLSNDNLILLSSLLEDKLIEDYEQICEQEISRAMIEKLPNSSISFHNILSKNYNFLAACAKNRTLQTILLSTEISNRFPIYGSVMKLRFTKGLVRKNFLDKSTQVFHNIFPVASKLLIDAVDDVFKCLDNNDLRHFLRMFQQDN
ncbi:poly [ADP-ribose] polymerase tankyrase-2-like [Microplitis mediator]|uniref:poly [ADP-ribose] polymerase tankyrase-2-like n=1 Tax=Microplitis mediator TaxID=375433 RepID=UPI002555CBD3|nr:poly [ADP-ribose] polymerase tankyrase-2-like [Microplitis mediator]